MKRWHLGRFRSGVAVIDFVNAHNLVPGEFLVLDVSPGRGSRMGQAEPPEIRVIYYAEKALV